MNVRVMTIDDYDKVIALFQMTPGIVVRDADSRAATEIYLRRNQGTSFVAMLNGEMVGCVMSGHDGRRGYLQHLVVRPDCRKQAIGERLFRSALKALQKVGIEKTHIFVVKDNLYANEYWVKRGWHLRDDIRMYSYVDSENDNA